MMDWGPGHFAIFIPFLAMVGAFALNHAAAWRRSSWQINRDARRLRAALLAELGLLRDLVANNLGLIERGEEYLLSCRVLTQVYRVHVGRLNLLHEAEIQSVVNAYCSAETAEVFIGAVTKAHGSHAYRVWLGDKSWDEMKHRLGEAQRAAETAIDQLDQARRRGQIFAMRPRAGQSAAA